MAMFELRSYDQNCNKKPKHESEFTTLLRIKINTLLAYIALVFFILACKYKTTFVKSQKINVQFHFLTRVKVLF